MIEGLSNVCGQSSIAGQSSYRLAAKDTLIAFKNSVFPKKPGFSPPLIAAQPACSASHGLAEVKQSS
jgi:hypothetical protein